MSHAVINFLTTVSLVYGGVREILPFIRYISNYIDTEFALIHAEDKGMGVVCAATWCVSLVYGAPVRMTEPILLGSCLLH